MLKSEYYSTLRDVLQNPNNRADTVKMRIPKFLNRRFQDLKSAGIKSSHGQLLGRALHFGLLGPHPFHDPLDAINDAFERYGEHDRNEKALVSRMLIFIGAQYGLKVTIEDY